MVQEKQKNTHREGKREYEKYKINGQNDNKYLNLDDGHMEVLCIIFNFSVCLKLF